jgi:hypothetical protein
MVPCLYCAGGEFFGGQAQSQEDGGAGGRLGSIRCVGDEHTSIKRIKVGIKPEFLEMCLDGLYGDSDRFHLHKSSDLRVVIQTCLSVTNQGQKCCRAEPFIDTHLEMPVVESEQAPRCASLTTSQRSFRRPPITDHKPRNDSQVEPQRVLRHHHRQHTRGSQLCGVH